MGSKSARPSTPSALVEKIKTKQLEVHPLMMAPRTAELPPGVLGPSVNRLEASKRKSQVAEGGDNPTAISFVLFLY